MITFVNTVFGDVGFDAKIEEVIEATSTVTSSPIETGAEINDHIFANPITYTLSGGVSNKVLFATDVNIVSPVNSSIGEPTARTRKHQAWDVLNEIQKAGEPFTVLADLEILDNMLLVGLNAPSNARLSEALVFNASLQQVIIVDTSEGVLTKEQLEEVQTQQQGTANADKGKTQKQEDLDDKTFGAKTLNNLFDEPEGG